MPWLDKCKALVHGYLCGQAGASAVLRVVMGEVNERGYPASKPTTFRLKFPSTSVALSSLVGLTTEDPAP